MADPNRPIDPEVIRLQSRIFAGKLRVGEVLNRAGIKRSTWWHWTKGAIPSLPNIRRMDAAITAKLDEKDAARGQESRDT